MKVPKERDPDWEFSKTSMQANTMSWGLVFNSFEELERIYFDHLKRELGNDRVWAVGPVLPPEDGEVETPPNRGGVSVVQCHEVMTWLDTRSDKSVVYVCFGSHAFFTGRQMDVLAAALENSGIDFILVVKHPDASHAGSDQGAVPDGFEDRVQGRGFVIKGCAPQVAILRHRAVGAFLTHCGWNSTLEGLTAGLVMLTWPMGADQFTNAKLLVDQLGVGIRVGEGTRNIPEPNDLARLLRTSVEGGTPERTRAKELSQAAITAVTGGSSDQELEELVKRLSELKK